MRKITLLLLLIVICHTVKAQTPDNVQSDNQDSIVNPWGTVNLDEVVIKHKRKRYRRKNNPAVELMRRVIAAKKKTDLSNHDYYSYDKYQKLTMSFNDISDKQLQNKFFSRRKYLTDQIEVSPYNHKRILPFSVDETVTKHVYRKDPRTEKDIITGQKSEGVGKLLTTGEVLNKMLKELFTDVNIYDDQIRLLQYDFVSPIGSGAISFYHFYIQDTIKIDNDSCYHLHFIPANQQDFGFRGDIYILKDSSLHVRRVDMMMPKKSDVNWIDDMQIEQEYTRLPNGEWVLSKDDMVAEIHANSLLQDLLVVRNTRLTGYSFEPQPRTVYRGPLKVQHAAGAGSRDKDFWNEHRKVELTSGEAEMGNFIKRMQKSKGWGWIAKIAQAFLENYVETTVDPDKKSKFDLGPINTFINHNYVDGLRLQLAGRTLAALSPHFFWNGYGSYGFKSHKWYYGTEFTYSLNKKELSPFEFPQRNIIFESSYDVMSPSDLNLLHNKNNVFMSLRSSSQDEMYRYNRQRLSFVYETLAGWRFHTQLQTQSNETAGELHFLKVNNGEEIRKIRLTDASVNVTWNPGVAYVNSKQKRVPINLDSPEISIGHTMGFKGFLGGDFKSNITQLSIYYRQWLGSWGYMNFNISAQAQWNKVPFPLLIQPPVNLSYFENDLSVSLAKDWEFLNDRQVFWSWHWDLNGKILNRLPLIKKLKWREYLTVKGFMGHLTEKNDPSKRPDDAMLYRFPANSHTMSGQPYWEVEAGIHNIFNFFSVGFVRRLTYLDHKDVDKWGVRFSFDFSF